MVLNQLFGGAYDGTHVLVTGHTGFKGSWLCLWLDAMGATVSGLSLPPATTPAHWSLLELESVRNHYVDLRQGDELRAAIDEIRPEVIFHLAAQSLVRVSYRDPATTFASNVTGLVNLLEAVRACDSVRAVVNATTDKVYLEHPTPGGYRECAPLGGHDPYSTSKACSELITECYRKCFFNANEPRPRIATARAGNVIGGGDWAEDRLVPDLVRAAVAQVPLYVRNPQAVRPWQHVLESLSGYLQLGHSLLTGRHVEGPWNFGPADTATLSVREMVARLQSHWPGVQVEAATGQHPREADILMLDSSQAARELNWTSVWDAEMAIGRTIDWYRAYYLHGELRSREDLDTYIEDARVAGIPWARPT